MEKVKLGKTDLEVARINFGGNVFGWTLNEKQSFEILDAFVDGGFNFIDTADTYSWWVHGSGGQSETILGNWMQARGNRDKLVIATKVGSETKKHPFDISKKHILKSVEESLLRLKTDHIDLYYTHFDDNITSAEETLVAYNEVIKEGKVRYIAASNLTPERLMGSLKVSEKNRLPQYLALQPHYNLMERNTYETDYAPIVKEYGLAVMPYFSLAKGFLSGKYRSEADLSKSVRGEGVRSYLSEKGYAVLKALDIVSSRHHCEPATVALAWLLAQPYVVAPIVSATSLTQLQTLLAAPNLILETDDLELLNKASC